MSFELFRAIKKGNLKIVRERLNQGESILEVTDVERWTFLHRALLTPGNPAPIEMIKFLLSNGVNPNAIDVYGNSALIYAVRQKNEDYVSTLIAAGADVNIVNLEGVSPLRASLATKPFHYNTIKILMENGADVLQKVDGGLTIQDYAKVKVAGDSQLLELFE
jgi:ankyrin repeat protein